MKRGPHWLPLKPLRLSRRTWRIVVLVALLVFALFTVALRRLDPDPAPNQHILRLVNPAVRLISWVDHGVENGFAWVFDLFRARSEVEQLREANAELRLQILQINEAMRRVGEWPALRAAAEELSLPTVNARVLSRTPDAENPLLLVDVGELDEVKEGCPAITPDGLLGRVVTVTAHSSAVRLITSHPFAVAALVTGTEIEGMVRAQGEGNPLLFVPEDQGLGLEPGAMLITSGRESSLFPSGIPIGRVASVQTSERAILAGVVEPFATDRGIEDLLIVTGPPQRHRPLFGTDLMGPPEVVAMPVSEEISTVSAEVTAEPAS